MTTTDRAVTPTLPPCCLAEILRRTADKVWESQPDEADRYELTAVKLLEQYALPFDRGHDIENCLRRTSAFVGLEQIEQV